MNDSRCKIEYKKSQNIFPIRALLQNLLMYILNLNVKKSNNGINH